jgi:hypothetical protein
MAAFTLAMQGILDIGRAPGAESMEARHFAGCPCFQTLRRPLVFVMTARASRCGSHRWLKLTGGFCRGPLTGMARVPRAGVHPEPL